MTDLEARAFTKRNGALWPSDFAAEEYLAAIPEGREVLVRASRPRSVPHHRWFFALLHKVVNASHQWDDEEDLLDDLKDATGHVHPGAINPLTSNLRRHTKSINFASMGEDKFRRFRDRCIYVLCHKLGYDPLVLMAEVDAAERRPSVAPNCNGEAMNEYISEPLFEILYDEILRKQRAKDDPNFREENGDAPINQDSRCA